MLSLYVIKFKLLTILSMVFMGLFSRFVLGFPVQSFSSASNYQNTSENHRFPDGGARTSMRFIPATRITQKRRRTLTNGDMKEDEILTSENNCDTSCFEFVGEILDQTNTQEEFSISRA